jgi:2-hydroxychromene-2-carboxylate isomerase
LHVVHHYFDYKSPYAYLAQQVNWELAALPNVEMYWVPYTLQIQKYLGCAELGDDGVDQVGERNDHQWRRVRYSYMDCRREANKRGLTILGPRRIFNSSLSHIAFLYVLRTGDHRRFHDAIFERFWNRSFNLESYEALTDLMNELGYDAENFLSFSKGIGLSDYEAKQTEAEKMGTFGVPSWQHNGQLYWGMERLNLLKEALDEPTS